MDLPAELIKIGYVIRTGDDGREHTVHHVYTPDTAPGLRHISFEDGDGRLFAKDARIKVVSVAAATDDEFDGL